MGRKLGNFFFLCWCQPVFGDLLPPNVAPNEGFVLYEEWRVFEIRAYIFNICHPRNLLRTGGKLVDAPGVRDDNEARDKVVKEYLREADGIWIVASINRAVNDKTAKNMLVSESENEGREKERKSERNSVLSVLETDDIEITSAICLL